MEATLPEAEKRQLSAVAIENAVRVLAKKHGMTVSRSNWHLDEGLHHAGPHKLDIIIDDTPVKIYFCDRELLHYDDDNSSYATESRLVQLMSELQETPLSQPMNIVIERVAVGIRP